MALPHEKATFSLSAAICEGDRTCHNASRWLLLAIPLSMGFVALLAFGSGMIGDSPSLQALPQRSPWDLNGLPTWSPAPRHGPGSGVWRAAKDAGFALGACPNGTVLDIGVNDGSDLDFFVQRGYCVLGVEANVALANKLQKRYRHIPSQVAVLNVGLDEVPGEMTFWMTRSLVHSSFERQKALTHDKMAKPQNVCEALGPPSGSLCG